MVRDLSLEGKESADRCSSEKRKSSMSPNDVKLGRDLNFKRQQKLGMNPKAKGISIKILQAPP